MERLELLVAQLQAVERWCEEFEKRLAAIEAALSIPSRTPAGDASRPAGDDESLS